MTLTASVSVDSEASPRPVILKVPAAKALPKVPEVIVALVIAVMAVKLPVVTTVPVVSGKEIVLSAVGFTTVKVVSLPSLLEPSKMTVALVPSSS